MCYAFFALSTHLLKARPSGPGYSGKTNLESEIGNRENSGKVNREASKFSSELSEAAMTARQTRMQRVAFIMIAEFLKNLERLLKKYLYTTLFANTETDFCTYSQTCV
jgi:hypothetical protein